MAKAKILAVFGNVALYGQERSNIYVFDTLQKQDYDLLLLVNDRGFHWHLQPEVEANNLKYQKIRFPWNYRKTRKIKSLWLYFSDTIRYNFAFLKAYRAYKPDYIHFANDFFFMTLAPSLFFLRCPIVFRLGDVPNIRFFLEKWLWKKLIIKKTTHFVCNSKFIAGTLQAISPNINKFSIINNIPTDRKVQCEESLPVSDPNVFTVLYVGQISKIKGVDLLYDAAIQLLKSELNVRFVFAGQLFQSTLYTEISESQDYETFKSKIVFTDRIQNVSHLYSISDILVVPSVVEEASPNVVGEAKLAGCPAIVFRSGGLPELISHNRDGYICKSKSTEELVIAINYYYENPSVLQEHRTNAFNSIQELGLTPENFLHKWTSVYKQTV